MKKFRPLLLLATLFVTQSACKGDEAKDLAEQTPAADERVIPSPLLNGGVRHDQSYQSPPALSGQTESGKEDDWLKRFKVSTKKFSSDDFRKLEYGILGMFSVKLPMAPHYVVIKVIPGCPASDAGIKPGDLEISANGHVWTAKDTRKTYWQISDGKAGTAVDIVVKRKGEILQFHLIRMNIEDLPNPSLRRIYERQLARFGPPTPPENIADSNDALRSLSAQGDDLSKIKGEDRSPLP